MADNQQLEQLTNKYRSVIDGITQEPGAQLQNVNIENGKLLIRATVPSDAAKNRVWDKIKRVDPGYSDLTANITSQGQTDTQESTRSRSADQTYTVKPGDTIEDQQAALRRRWSISAHLRSKQGQAQ